MEGIVAKLRCHHYFFRVLHVSSVDQFIHVSYTYVIISYPGCGLNPFLMSFVCLFFQCPLSLLLSFYIELWTLLQNTLVVALRRLSKIMLSLYLR